MRFPRFEPGTHGGQCILQIKIINICLSYNRIVDKMLNPHQRKSNALGKHNVAAKSMPWKNWMAQIKDLLVQTNSENTQIESNWIYNTYNYTSQFSYLPYICHIVTKVSVLFNLRISGCELRDNHYVLFT